MAIHTFVAGAPFTAVQANTINTGADSGAYTPTLTGMTIGSGGTNTANYTFDGGVLVVAGRIVFGSSGQTFPGATSAIALPAGYELDDLVAGIPVGIVAFGDASTGSIFVGGFWAATATTVSVKVLNADLAALYFASVSTTTPFVWATSDSIAWQFQARAVVV